MGLAWLGARFSTDPGPIRKILTHRGEPFEPPASAGERHEADGKLGTARRGEVGEGLAVGGRELEATAVAGGDRRGPWVSWHRAEPRVAMGTSRGCRLPWYDVISY